MTRQQIKGAAMLLGIALLWTLWRLWQLRFTTEGAEKNGEDTEKDWMNPFVLCDLSVILCGLCGEKGLVT